MFKIVLGFAFALCASSFAFAGEFDPNDAVEVQVVEQVGVNMTYIDGTSGKLAVDNGCSGCCSRLGLEDRWCKKSPNMCEKHRFRCIYK